MHRTDATDPRRGSKKALVLLAGVAFGALVASDPAAAQAPTAADLDRLLAVIEAQQQQIDALRAEVDAMKSAQAQAVPVVAAAPPAAVAAAPAAGTVAQAAPGVPEEVRPEAQMVEEGFTWRDRSGRSLTLSGQVNPAFNVVDDGASTDVFIVDNDTSSSRFRLDADASLDETSFGAAIEVGASPNNSNSVSQLTPNVDAPFDLRKAELSVRNDTYGRIQVGKGSSAADDTAEYDLSLVAGSIMYAGVADIAGGILFTDGEDFINLGTAAEPEFLAVNGAFFDYDPGNLDRVRYDSPMLGPAQGSVSFGQDDQWAAAVTLGGDYGDWSGWEVGDFTVLAAASIYNPDEEGVDYAYAGSASILHNPTGVSLTLSTGGQKLDEGDDPYNLYGKLGYDTQFWPIGATGFGIDYTNGKNISGEGDEGTSYGLAAVQQIERFGIDVYTQVRWYDLDSATEPDVKDVFVSTFGTKLTF
jgi:hypothetical protein